MSNNHLHSLDSRLEQAEATITDLQAENARLQQRAKRAELLVRLSMDERVSRGGNSIYVVAKHPDGYGNIYERIKCTYTNGIPDLTPEQWERLAQLERGGG